MERPRLKKPTEAPALLSTLKDKPSRATKEEMAERRMALVEIVEEQHPMTVRQVYYQMEVRGLVPKTIQGYWKVDGLLIEMRRDGTIPYEWIVDHSRHVRVPPTWVDIPDMLNYAADIYRKSLWEDADVRPFVFIEKEALLGVVESVTNALDVQLWPAKGYSSMSFLHSGCVNYIEPLFTPIHVYYLHDWDPSGVGAFRETERAVREYAPAAELTFTSLAITAEQRRQWDLPTRESKRSDPRYRKFASMCSELGLPDTSVELDAIAPNVLRDLVRKAIMLHMPAKRLKALKAEESEEKQRIRELVDDIGDAT